MSELCLEQVSKTSEQSEPRAVRSNLRLKENWHEEHAEAIFGRALHGDGPIRDDGRHKD